MLIVELVAHRPGRVVPKSDLPDVNWRIVKNPIGIGVAVYWAKAHVRKLLTWVRVPTPLDRGSRVAKDQSFTY